VLLLMLLLSLGGHGRCGSRSQEDRNKTSGIQKASVAAGNTVVLRRGAACPAPVANKHQGSFVGEQLGPRLVKAIITPSSGD